LAVSIRDSRLISITEAAATEAAPQQPVLLLKQSNTRLKEVPLISFFFFLQNTFSTTTTTTTTIAIQMKKNEQTLHPRGHHPRHENEQSSNRDESREEDEEEEEKNLLDMKEEYNEEDLIAQGLESLLPLNEPRRQELWMDGPTSEEMGEIERSILKTLSKEQGVTVMKALRGQPLFIAGGAGTGKSTTIEAIAKAFEWMNVKRGGKWKTLELVAPTGVAAVNIGGRTIHNLAGIGTSEDTIESMCDKMKRAILFKRRNKRKYGYQGSSDMDDSPLASVDAICIDEAFMVSPHLFQLLDAFCRIIRNQRHRAFGGVCVYVVGDPAQLEPIRKRRPPPPPPSQTTTTTNRGGLHVSNHASSRSQQYGLWDRIEGVPKAIAGRGHPIPLWMEDPPEEAEFIFDTKAWRDASFEVVHLTQQHRQKEERLIRFLAEIAQGRVTHQGMDLVQERKQAFRALIQEQKKQDAQGAPYRIDPTYIYSRNVQVDAKNNESLERIISPTVVYNYRSFILYGSRSLRRHQHFIKQNTSKETPSFSEGKKPLPSPTHSSRMKHKKIRHESDEDESSSSSSIEEEDRQHVQHEGPRALERKASKDALSFSDEEEDEEQEEEEDLEQTVPTAEPAKPQDSFDRIHDPIPFPEEEAFHSSSIRVFASNSCARPYIKLRVGCQVMLLANLDTQLKLVNGSRGVVTGFWCRKHGVVAHVANRQQQQPEPPKILNTTFALRTFQESGSTSHDHVVRFKESFALHHPAACPLNETDRLLIQDQGLDDDDDDGHNPSKQAKDQEEEKNQRNALQSYSKNEQHLLLSKSNAFPVQVRFDGDPKTIMGPGHYNLYPIVLFSHNPNVEYVIGLHCFKRHNERLDITSVYSQIPLSLAWATSIHKAQGQSISQLVVDISPSIFMCGQAYVALSRATSIQGLYIDTFDPLVVKANPRVIEFANSGFRVPPPLPPPPRRQHFSRPFQNNNNNNNNFHPRPTNHVFADSSASFRSRARGGGAQPYHNRHFSFARPHHQNIESFIGKDYDDHDDDENEEGPSSRDFSFNQRNPPPPYQQQQQQNANSFTFRPRGRGYPKRYDSNSTNPPHQSYARGNHHYNEGESRPFRYYARGRPYNNNNNQSNDFFMSSDESRQHDDAFFDDGDDDATNVHSRPFHLKTYARGYRKQQQQQQQNPDQSPFPNQQRVQRHNDGGGDDDFRPFKPYARGHTNNHPHSHYRDGGAPRGHHPYQNRQYRPFWSQERD